MHSGGKVKSYVTVEHKTVARSSQEYQNSALKLESESSFLEIYASIAWLPYDRPDHPSRLKKHSDHWDHHIETLPRRLQMARTTETTLIAWIELSSIRTISTIV